MANKRSWLATPAKKIKPPLPDSIKSTLKEKADKLIEEVIKPQHVKPAPNTNDFNYIADIDSKWYRNYFYFCATYNCPSPNAISPFFEIKFVRMEYVAVNNFNLANTILIWLTCGIPNNGMKYFKIFPWIRV